ncbi:hypothetical protein DEQ92_20245 [Haloferax sp. Atlit-6N]|uniref:hypothetical protein n=1 Tax=Haloferax sp. Atlit-6N TaxID=2077205 RepID=UPI000E23F96A|nr:hypothetical protein [Haloferax sp. Atlit-6N]REA00186.1 hypothetical protein DEQ92_20245 [Haloferax sp. Atlit-6N]
MKLKDWLIAAGSPSEDSHAFDGFLSYHAEPHAAGLGLAAGFLFGATGDERLLSVGAGIAIAALRGADKKAPTAVLADVAQEPHYFFGGVVAGAIVGYAARLF